VRVGILGIASDSGNRGVQALGESLVRLCQEAQPGAEIRLFGSDREGRPVTMRPEGTPLEIRLIHWRLRASGGFRHYLPLVFVASLAHRLVPLRGFRSWLASRVPWIAEVTTMDLLGDIRGGDSFSDIYGMKRFLIASLPLYSVLLLGGKLVQFPQTFGPYRSRVARWVARDLLRRSVRVIARDVHSRAVAQGLLGDYGEVGLSPDVAFALHVRAPDRLEIDGKADQAVKLGTIGVNVNGLMFHGGYNRNNQFGLKLDYALFLEGLLRRLLADTTADLLLVPHTLAPEGDIESDNWASKLVLSRLPEKQRARVRLVTGNYDAHEMKAIIGQCDFFIGSRMHSCIAALSQGVPCAGVAYSMKFIGVFESVGHGLGIVDAREHTTEQAVDRVVALYGRRDEGREELGRRAREAREKLKDVFSRLLACRKTGSVA
jgi:colanic acid/amylovoran biosynthesis protein